MNTTSSPVVHFEMPAQDRKRMSDFYTNVFGWNMQQLGPEMGNYVMVQTSETDDKGFPKKPGMINGGFYDASPDQPGHPTLVISVTDVRAYVEKVKTAGGEIVSEPMDIPGIGSFASFRDTEGNRVSMLQPLPM